MSALPVVVIGAGPVGLAAAAHLVERGLTPVVFEAGPRVAASMWDWGHVQLFTPWSFLTDPACVRLLRGSGWTAPPADHVPTGAEVICDYLDPLADALCGRIELMHRVRSVSRVGHDRMKDGARGSAPFLVVLDTPDGPKRVHASAVIDASGTWTTPNPMGAGGVLADGEAALADLVRYGMPDVLGRERARYAGKRVLVVGSGHSSIGTALALSALPDTLVAWGVRGTDPSRLWGGGAADEIQARGALGTRVHDAVFSGAVTLITGLSISAVRRTDAGVHVIDVDGQVRVVVDEIVVATGSRPDLSLHRELRLALDPATEASGTLGPLIDPNNHSCGSVPPHGAAELAHPEPDVFIVGIKSYGRAPTFLLRTGYEQVRSVVAHLAGDHDAAARVELVLPQTGVCTTEVGTVGGCC